MTTPTKRPGFTTRLRYLFTGEVPGIGEQVSGKHAKHATRQQKAFRLWTALVSVLVVAVLSFGIAETALHGFNFFVFRSQGVGSTPSTGLNEDQGPGQPNANGHHGCISNAVGTCLSPEGGKTVVHPITPRRY